jgi:2-phosphoglycolate phosphatase
MLALRPAGKNCNSWFDSFLPRVYLDFSVIVVMKRAVELLMFDLDGTLAATGQDLASSVNHIRSELGLEPLDEAVVYGHVGRGSEHLVSRSLPKKYAARLEEILQRFLDHYERHLLDTTVLYPHVKEILDRFSAKKKAVVTNKRHYLSVAILKGLGIEDYFDAVIGGDSGWDKKPDPACLNHLLATLKVAPGKAVIVGDGDTDIKAGKGAGVYTCGVTYGLCGREELAAAEPDLLIDDIRELTDYIY